jgi:hypothetical protein
MAWVVTAIALLGGPGVAAAAPGTCVGDPQTGDRVALVIGESNYGQDAQISGVKDAVDMACALQELGFTVVGPLLDADIDTINPKLEEFSRKIAGAKVALFYFSGHGAQEAGENYLVPRAARYAVKDLLKLSTVLQAVAQRAGGATDRIVILDACRTETIKIEGLSHAQPGFSEIDSTALKNTLIALAASFGQSAASGSPNGNSPYTAELLLHLLKAGFSLREILTEVTVKVSGDRSLQQTPWSDGGDTFASRLYLRPAVRAVAKVFKADDELQIVQREGAQEKAVITLKDRPVNIEVPLALRAGLNQIELRVFNERTYRNTHSVESAEGWYYSLVFQDAAGNSLGRAFSDAEEVVYKDGPHHGKWFTVATLNLFVSPTAAKATVEMQDAVDGIAQREGGPSYELNQALLCKLTILPASRLLRPNRETLFLVGGEKTLRDKARRCFSRPAMKVRIFAAAGKKVNNPAAIEQAISEISGECAGDHLWYVVEDHKPGELADVPVCQ